MPNESTSIGPNVKRLVIHKMSLLAIPIGSGERSLGLGVQAMMNAPQLFREAHEWVVNAIALVKAAPDCAYMTDEDDEEIAGVLLKGIEERQG